MSRTEGRRNFPPTVWVAEAQHLGGWRLWLRFSDGVCGEVDLKDRLHGPVFEPLRDVNYFARVVVDPEINTVTWPSGADFAPEFLYERATTDRSASTPSERSAGRGSFDSDGRYRWPVLPGERIARARLDIDQKRDSNPLPWRGQFSPQLVLALVQDLSASGDVVLDPFAGSGTILRECARLGREGHAVELNPAAYCLSRIYEMTSQPHQERETALLTLRDAINTHFPLGNLFDQDALMTDDTGESALRVLVESASNTQQSILRAALVVLLDVGRDALLPRQVEKAFSQVCRVVRAIPETRVRQRAYHADARALPLPDQSVDLIVTSPPYINVFNYHQQYRGSAEVLRWDLLDIAQSEIGANRKFRQNRFLTVIQYCLDMAQALGEMRRVLRPGGCVAMVVGRESFVRKTRMFNGELLCAIATDAVGLSLSARQERSFTNRFGARIWEDVLYFQQGSQVPNAQDRARTVACDYLSLAATRAPQSEAPGIAQALAAAPRIAPSQAFRAVKERVSA